MTDCWYCGQKGHRESECWKKKADSDRSGSGRTEQENQQQSHYVEGLEGAENRSGPTLVMKHKVNLMVVNTSKLNEVWYVDSGASNHMTSHKEWFSYLEKPEQLGVVETCDDTPHKGKLMNVLHVLTITKNLVSIE